jgi:hypothetical protein
MVTLPLTRSGATSTHIDFRESQRFSQVSGSALNHQRTLPEQVLIEAGFGEEPRNKRRASPFRTEQSMSTIDFTQRLLSLGITENNLSIFLSCRNCMQIHCT